MPIQKSHEPKDIAYFTYPNTQASTPLSISRRCHFHICHTPYSDRPIYPSIYSKLAAPRSVVSDGKIAAAMSVVSDGKIAAPRSVVSDGKIAAAMDPECYLARPSDLVLWRAEPNAKRRDQTRTQKMSKWKCTKLRTKMTYEKPDSTKAKTERLNVPRRIPYFLKRYDQATKTKSQPTARSIEGSIRKPMGTILETTGHLPSPSSPRDSATDTLPRFLRAARPGRNQYPPDASLILWWSSAWFF